MTEEQDSGLGSIGGDLTALTTEGFRQMSAQVEAEAEALERERHDNPEAASVNEMASRIEYVRMIVSLWSHVCMIDGELAVQEEISIGEMMHQFFGGKDAMFPHNEADVDAIFDELIMAFNTPAPMDEIINYAKNNELLREVFFEEACCIVASDSKYHHKESDFLRALGNSFGLNDAQQTKIKSRYISQFAE